MSSVSFFTTSFQIVFIFVTTYYKFQIMSVNGVKYRIKFIKKIIRIAGWSSVYAKYNYIFLTFIWIATISKSCSLQYVCKFMVEHFKSSSKNIYIYTAIFLNVFCRILHSIYILRYVWHQFHNQSNDAQLNRWFSHGTLWVDYHRPSLSNIFHGFEILFKCPEM